MILSRNRARTLMALAGFVCAAAMAGSGAQASPAPALPDWSGVWYFDNGPMMQFEMPLPFTPEYQAAFDRQVAAMRGGPLAGPPPGAEDGQASPCHAPRFPSMMFARYPIEFVVTPEVVVTLHELDRGIRHIYTDGRGHGSGAQRTYSGDSVGHWEGDTLVVETTGLQPSGRIDIFLPHSDQVRVTERIRKTGPDTLEDRFTIEDPKVLTRPVSTVRIFKRHADFKILEYTCQDNLRDFEPTNK